MTSTPINGWEAAFDRVLVDAPCSGLGVLRRRAEARWTKTETGLREFPALQQKILDNASRYVKPGGVLVYSTCTIFCRITGSGSKPASPIPVRKRLLKNCNCIRSGMVWTDFI